MPNLRDESGMEMIDSPTSSGHGSDAGKHDRTSSNPQTGGMAPMRSDVLSQVLTLIRLRGELVYTARMKGAWSVAFPPGPAHFYIVEEGAMWVASGAEAPLHVTQGDLLLLPQGKGHVMGNDPATAPVAIGALIEGHFDHGSAVLSYETGTGPACRLIGGQFQFEGDALAAVLAALPQAVHIAHESLHAGGWLAPISGFMVREAQGAEPGSSLMVSRLIDLLVIRTLRTWASNQMQPASWVGGLAEERIGKALAAIHADPYRPWRVAELADIAAMSRSQFSERFRARVGEAPLHYVKRWKLTLAADMLAGGATRVTQAAQRTGYTSDAAFSRAFKAQFGYAPSVAGTRHTTA